MQEWSRRVRSGQICESNRKSYQSARSLREGKVVAIKLIHKHVSGAADAEFAERTEHYCYATDKELKLWPHIANDVYFTACLYDAASESINLAAKDAAGAVLPPIIKFDADNRALQLLHPNVVQYAEQIDRAIAEFHKEHNQRMGKLHSRGYLAWLLSEYIKDVPHTVAVQVDTMIVGRNRQDSLEP
jgi:hypothetical protein